MRHPEWIDDRSGEYILGWVEELCCDDGLCLEREHEYKEEVDYMEEARISFK